MQTGQIKRVMRLSFVRREPITGNGDPARDDGQRAADEASEEHKLHQVDSQNR